MRIFVTGATGFVGGHLLRELTGRGHSINALVRTRKKAEPLEMFIDRLVVGDLFNRRALIEGMADADAVIHAAGLLAARRTATLWQVNVEGTKQLLRVASEVGGGLRRFVQISSIAAAGPSRPGEPITEEHPPQPVSVLGETKLAAEREVWTHTEAFEVVILRPPIVYGPGDKETFAIFKMVHDGSVWTVGHPRLQLSVLFVTDLANGIADALETPAAANEVFFLASDARPGFVELIHAIEEALGTRARIRTVPRFAARAVAAGADGWRLFRGSSSLLNRDKINELLAPGWLCSTQKAKHLLGWEPAVGIREGIRQAAEWYFERGWLEKVV